MPFPLHTDLEARLGIDQRAVSLHAEDVRLQLSPEDRPTIEARFTLHYEGDTERLEIANLDLHSQAVHLRGEANATQLSTAPQVQGKLEIPAADPRPLLTAWQAPLPAFSAPDDHRRSGRMR